MTKQTTTYKQTEIGLIPEDWEVKEFREIIAKIIGGGTPSRNVKEFWNGSIPWMTVKDFATFNLNSTQEYITTLGVKNSATRIIPKNNLIIATRIALGKIVTYNVDVAINQDLKTIEIEPNTDKQYFIYYYRFLENKIIEKGSGSTVLGLSIEDLKSFQIPLPPLSEQQAIAAALSDCDAWIDSQEKRLAKKRLIKQGAMQQLLSPKENWEVKKLGEVCESFSGGTPNTARDDFYGGNINYIASGDLNQKRINSVEGRITALGLSNSSAKIAPKNSLLIAMYGATAGVVALNQIEGAINQAILAVIPFRNYNVEFLFYFFDFNKEWIIITYTQGGQPNLSGGILKNIEIPFPTLPEQTRIATILSDMDAEISALENELAKSRQIKNGMMQELLTGRRRISLHSAAFRSSTDGACPVSSRLSIIDYR